MISISFTVNDEGLEQDLLQEATRQGIPVEELYTNICGEALDCFRGASKRSLLKRISSFIEQSNVSELGSLTEAIEPVITVDPLK